jgi:hypothetical protein
MGAKRNACRVLWKSQKERDQQEDVNIGGRMILKVNLRERGLNDMEWIHLVHDRGQWRGPANTVMNFQIP